MAIKLNDILHLTEEEISNSRIELNMIAGQGGEAFMDRWLRLSPDEKECGINACCYWG